MDILADARQQMVDEQIAARGVRDPLVLDAMRRVPRHEFVDPSAGVLAYADRAMAIDRGQAISQPYMVAVMTESLKLSRGARVLEVGTGSGYQAAVLACIAKEVVSIERHEPLADQASERLARLGFDNVRVIVGDGSKGFAERAPYDGIIVTAGAPRVPDALREQLAEGGRLVIPVGSQHDQRLLVVVRHGSEFQESTREGCVFVPLVGEQGWPDHLPPDEQR